jgi:hypothetical protein
MKPRSGTDWLLIAPMLAATGFFVARTLWPEVWSSWGISDVVSLRTAGVLKFLFLLAGGVVALRNAARLGGGNPMRPGWLHLGMGMLATAIGQAALARYQFSPAEAAPFPSVADFFFFLSYPLFIAALVNFLKGYAEAGYSLGSARQRAALSVLAGVVGLAVVLLVLRPVMLKPGVEPLARFLNTAYPALDLVLLLPAGLLLRASLPLRGGEVWKAWLALLTGFVFMGIGDILFAYFDALNVRAVDPLIHPAYLISYGSLALGAVRQSRLLKG